MNTSIKAFEDIRDLCLQKLNKETDLDWGEMVIELGLDCSADHLRKISYGIKKYDDYIKAKGMDNIADDLKMELNQKIFELKKTQVQLSDLRTEINRQSRYQSRYEHMIDMAETSISNLSTQKPFAQVETPTYDDETLIREGVLLISDVHYGQVTENFLNSYNSDIFKKRLAYLTSRVVEIHNTHNLQKIHILGLGDLINGLIHTTTRLSNRESIVQQVIDMGEAISELAYVLSKYIPYVTISLTDDNHSRVFANKNENTDKDSFVPLMKEFIKLRIKDHNRIIFLDNNYDSSLVTLKVCDKWIVGSHGDKDKLSTAIPRLTSLLKVVPDYVCIGHYHNVKEDTFGETELIVNGSFGGTDEYAKNLRLHSKPTQKFMIFNKEHGRECTYNIVLKEI